MDWQSGDRVTVRGARWRVVKCTPFGDCTAIALSHDPSGSARTLLLPFDRPRRPADATLRVVSPRRWAHATAALLQSSFPEGGLRFCPAGIHLLPYQLEPALAMLRHGVLRLLLADDVGLGKTVEAGLIAGEIARGDPLARTLILCPASLAAQWQGELAALFGLDVRRADASWLQAAARELPPDSNPWSLPGIYLASMDFIKRAEVLSAIETLYWDLLVVDEAHGATAGSHRQAAIHAAARRAMRVLLLTATPHSGDDGQFAALCGLGSHDSSPPIAIFRRTAADTPGAGLPARRALLSIRPTDAERRMHDLLEAYTGRVWIESRRRGRTAGELVATVLRKRALSSAASLAISARRRLALLGGQAIEPAQMSLPLGDAELDADAAPADAILAAQGLDDVGGEAPALRAIVESAGQAASGESKLRALLRFLRRAGEPAIVFSEYRDTAERLAGELSGAGCRVAVLHGGQGPGERAAALERFAGGGTILVATDAASEGLNLHRACRLVVHYELPWTPLRLHQRGGRVNRIGQTRRVHEVALVAGHTAEQLVLVPLLRRTERAATFESGSLAQRVSESRVASYILTGTPLDAGPPPRVADGCARYMDLRAEAAIEAARLHQLRRLAFKPPALAPDAAEHAPLVPVAQRVRRGTRTARWLLVVSTWLWTSDGEPIEHALTGLHVDAGRTRCPRRAGDLLKLARDTLRGVQHALPRILEERLPGPAARQPARHELAKTMRARKRAIHGDIDSTARQIVQAGLFERRAVRAARLRAATASMCEDDGKRGNPGGSGIRATHQVRGMLLEGRR